MGGNYTEEHNYKSGCCFHGFVIGADIQQVLSNTNVFKRQIIHTDPKEPNLPEKDLELRPVRIALQRKAEVVVI